MANLAAPTSNLLERVRVGGSIYLRLQGQEEGISLEVLEIGQSKIKLAYGSLVKIDGEWIYYPPQSADSHRPVKVEELRIA